MKNWKESGEYKRAQAGLITGETITMPDIATGAFLLEKNGKKYKFQLRHNEYEKEALYIHQKLLAMGWDLPKIVETREIDGQTYTLTDWWEGKTGLELRNDLGKLPLNYYKGLGDWVGKLHTTKVDGKSISVNNYWPRNTLITTRGQIIYLDLNKLYFTEYVQARIEECIVAETPTVNREQANAFLSAYREHRPYCIKDILNWHLDNLSENWHDVWIDGELFYKGKTNFQERWRDLNLPESFKGMYVLDLGYGNGMFALEAAKRGAERVYAIDDRNRSIKMQRHRMSDYGKLLSVYHGFTEWDLLYKHMSVNTEWFIEKHMPDSLRYLPKKKYDLVFALNIMDYIDEDLKPKFLHMLEQITDNLYREDVYDQ